MIVVDLQEDPVLLTPEDSKEKPYVAILKVCDESLLLPIWTMYQGIVLGIQIMSFCRHHQDLWLITPVTYLDDIRTLEKYDAKNRVSDFQFFLCLNL